MSVDAKRDCGIFSGLGLLICFSAYTRDAARGETDDPKQGARATLRQRVPGTLSRTARATLLTKSPTFRASNGGNNDAS